jgi:hypothetical protein
MTSQVASGAVQDTLAGVLALQGDGIAKVQTLSY